MERGEAGTGSPDVQPVRRRNNQPAHAYDAMRMNRHQASAVHTVSPTGVPASNPRSVSMIGVTGCLSAIHRRTRGIVSVGTKALDR